MNYDSAQKLGYITKPTTREDALKVIHSSYTDMVVFYLKDGEVYQLIKNSMGVIDKKL